MLNKNIIICHCTGWESAIKRLKKEAIPSIFPWSKPVTETAVSRKERARKREERSSSTASKQIEATDTNVDSMCIFNYLDIAGEETVDVIQEGYNTVLDSTVNCESFKSVSVQTLQSGLVKSTNIGTQFSMAAVISHTMFKNDNRGIHFYTGLESFDKFVFVFQTLGEAAFHLTYMYGPIHSFDAIEQFLMVLMKLRRHTTNFELSRLFVISEADVYNIFCTWIRFMSLQWQEISIWPQREVVRFFSPTDFQRKFPTTRVIIDGTECPVKKSKLPTAQSSTFSTYKNRNTVKVLIGSTPGGLISYISPAYGGSTSDRQIVERGRLHLKCDPGDSIMADKGFNVQDIFAPYNITVNIPTFFRKKNRMSSKAVLQDRKISSKRVHIERLIGLAKTYRILIEPMNVSETLLASDIIFVCFMLCNFRSCIVPKTA